MKSSRLLMLCALLFVLTPAFAETGAPTGYGKARVPFDFRVGNKMMPAGDYRLTVQGVRLQLTRVGESEMAVVFTTTVGGDPSQYKTPHLLFHRYGDERFLAEAWVGESRMGHRLFASESELRLARSTPQTGESVAMLREDK